MKGGGFRYLKHACAFGITLLLWAYFLFGYLFLLPVFFLPYIVTHRSAAAAFQKLNHLHLQNFFGLVRIFIPRTDFHIAPEIRTLRSSILVCNHVSYLDPILLVSIYAMQTTIVKSTFFRVPIFGWFLKKAGYIPSSPDEMTGAAMIANLEAIKAHLAAGGNLFVFPEGTRSRDGRVGDFSRGVFSIARYCNQDVHLLMIRNTDGLFRPGAFTFNVFAPRTIAIDYLGRFKTAQGDDGQSVGAMAAQAKAIFDQEAARGRFAAQTKTRAGGK